MVTRVGMLSANVSKFDCMVTGADIAGRLLAGRLTKAVGETELLIDAGEGDGNRMFQWPASLGSWGWSAARRRELPAREPWSDQTEVIGRRGPAKGSLLCIRSLGTAFREHADPGFARLIGLHCRFEPCGPELQVRGLQAARETLRQPELTFFMRNEAPFRRGHHWLALIPRRRLQARRGLLPHGRRVPHGAWRIGDGRSRVPLAPAGEAARTRQLAQFRNCSSNANSPTILIDVKASILIRGHGPVSAATFGEERHSGSRRGITRYRGATT